MEKTKKSKMEVFVKYVTLLLIAITIMVVGYRYIQSVFGTDEEMQIVETPATVEDVKPIGKLYLYSTITEDYVKDSFKGSGIGSSLLGKGNGLFKKSHDCVQVLRQQVSFVMDMDKIVYSEDSLTNIVYVTLPKVEYVHSTIYSWHMSDDENEEAKVGYNASSLISKVESKIARKYDTAKNRDYAKTQAKDILTRIFKQIGKEVEFSE